LKRNATYVDLYGISENSVGEIVGGEPYASPRPAYRHVGCLTLEWRQPNARETAERRPSARR
jgi:hypothetical protein